ncbi:hypothetical protein ACWF94_30590 [Streptomyces sp. NPDC055078]
MRTRTRSALAAFPLALALALTGCGSGDDDDGKVASAAEGENAKKAGSAKPSLDPKEMGLKFAACMRKNGVPMEDPVDGRVMVKQKAGEGPDRATMDKAMKACREFQPQGTGPGGKPDPKVRDAMQKYAQCMRKNGVEDFPDPQAGGGIRMDAKQAEDPDFKKAEQACKGLMSAGRQAGEKQE